MEKYLKIVSRGEQFQVNLQVGNQGFLVEPLCDTQDEAEWVADQLKVALTRLVEENTTRE